jgi:hypothetical protein
MDNRQIPATNLEKQSICGGKSIYNDIITRQYGNEYNQFANGEYAESATRTGRSATHESLRLSRCPILDIRLLNP